MNDTEAAERPLTGIRVVEAGTYISAPFAGMVLAHLGAEVLKVEPPDGDPARRFGLRAHGLSALWANLNHGKQGVALDLKAQAGRAVMASLLSEADVFVQNWRPGVADRLGLGPADLLGVNPRLVSVAITGFGDTGPYAAFPAFDSVIQAVSGLIAAESPDGHPAQLRSFLADKTTAMMAVQAVLAGLVQRARTGRGSHIDLAMLDVMAYFNFPDLGQQQAFVEASGDVTPARTRSCCLRTCDGYVALAPVAGRQIRAAVEAAGHPEWADVLRREEPLAVTGKLFDLLETVTPAHDTGHWLRQFAAWDVPAAPVLSFAEQFTDPQAEHNAVYGQATTILGPLRTVRYPARFAGRPLPPVAPPPIALGTPDDVLEEHHEQQGSG